MGLFKEDIHIHLHLHTSPGGESGDITQKFNKIMGQLEDLQLKSTELKAQVTELQASVDLEQAQIAELLATNATVVTGLNEQITALQAQLANAVDPTALQGVIDELTTTKESIALTKSDLEATV